jgi:hypothetical protein
MSALIGIRCDECGKIETADPFEHEFDDLRALLYTRGWRRRATVDLCPFDELKRKLKERAEATR